MLVHITLLSISNDYIHGLFQQNYMRNRHIFHFIYDVHTSIILLSVLLSIGAYCRDGVYTPARRSEKH
jgi:hypothetical protein